MPNTALALLDTVTEPAIAVEAGIGATSPRAAASPKDV